MVERYEGTSVNRFGSRIRFTQLISREASGRDELEYGFRDPCGCEFERIRHRYGLGGLDDSARRTEWDEIVVGKVARIS